MQNLHGGDIYRNPGVMDFSANLNPLGMPEAIRQAMQDSLSAAAYYPDPFCEQLRYAIAKWEQVDDRQVICGAGAADLIYRLVYAIKPKRALVIAPGFAEYEQALLAQGTQVHRYYLDHVDFMVREDILEQLTKDLDMLCLCSPNNPTGKVIAPELLQEIVKKCVQKEIYFLMDECFLNFTTEEKAVSLTKTARSNPFVFVLKAFTKMYCLAGVRLGYAITDNAPLLERMYASGPPWNVSVLAQAAGMAAVQLDDFVEQTREYVKEQRQYLWEALQQLPVTVWESAADFLFFRARPGLQQDLLRQKILIRDCSNYPGLTKGYYRIAVKSQEENQKLVQAMAEVLGTDWETVRSRQRNDIIV